MKKTLSILGAIALLVLVAFGYYTYAPRRTPAGQPPLTTLYFENFSELQKQFNDADDRVRILLLLSPT